MENTVDRSFNFYDDSDYDESERAIATEYFPHPSKTIVTLEQLETILDSLKCEAKKLQPQRIHYGKINVFDINKHVTIDGIEFDLTEPDITLLNKMPNLKRIDVSAKPSIRVSGDFMNLEYYLSPNDETMLEMGTRAVAKTLGHSCKATPYKMTVFRDKDFAENFVDKEADDDVLFLIIFARNYCADNVVYFQEADVSFGSKPLCAKHQLSYIIFPSNQDYSIERIFAVNLQHFEKASIQQLTIA